MKSVEELERQLAEISDKKKALETQLGESLYDASKSDRSIRIGHEPLFEAIDAIEAEIAEINAEQERIKAEEEAEAEKNSGTEPGVACPNCKKPCSSDDKFCSQCGTPLDVKEEQAEQEESAKALMCIKCGKPINEGDLFCMSCGAKQ